jgi:hypothetical protein
MGHSTRRIPLLELRRFACKSSHSLFVSFWIEIQSLGMPAGFALGIKEKRECDWLVGRLNEWLRSLRANLEVTHTIVRRPHDCRWEFIKNGHGVQFVKRGRVGLGWVLSQPYVLVVCLFFVGLPTVVAWQAVERMLSEPSNVTNWILAACSVGVFALFAGMGVAAGVANLLEALGQTTWQIGSSIIKCTAGLRALAWRRTYIIQSELHLSVEVDGETALPGGLPEAAASPPLTRSMSRPQSKLRFLEPTGKEVCAINRLTGGEAKWMQDILAQEAPVQFAPLRDDNKGPQPK